MSRETIARRLAAAKAAGRWAERKVALYLQTIGYVNAERGRMRGARDAGDIAGVPGLVIEVKNEQRLDLPAYLRELERQMDNTGDVDGVVIVRRRGHGDVGQWYAVQTVDNYFDLLRRARDS